jgi:Tfp pilus assembly pilus retraction ATPase PilT
MRSPVAVLWDKARSAMVYVTAAEAGRLTLVTLGSRPARIAAEALVQSITSMSQAELQAAVGAGLFEVMEGAV